MMIPTWLLSLDCKALSLGTGKLLHLQWQSAIYPKQCEILCSKSCIPGSGDAADNSVNTLITSALGFILQNLKLLGYEGKTTANTFKQLIMAVFIGLLLQIHSASDIAHTSLTLCPPRTKKTQVHTSLRHYNTRNQATRKVRISGNCCSINTREPAKDPFKRHVLLMLKVSETLVLFGGCYIENLRRT